MKLLRLLAVCLKAPSNGLESNCGMENGVKALWEKAVGESELRFIHWVYTRIQIFKEMCFQFLGQGQTHNPLKHHTCAELQRSSHFLALAVGVCILQHVCHLP